MAKQKVGIYKNNVLDETYKLAGGITNIGDAWNKSKLVCSRTGWNEDTFANDVSVTVEKIK